MRMYDIVMLCSRNVYIGVVSTGITSSFWQLILASIHHSPSLDMSLPLATSAWEFDACYRVKGVWWKEISQGVLVKTLKGVCRSQGNWMFAFMGCVDVVIPKVSCCIVPVKSFFFVCVKLGHVMCFVIEEVTGNSCREVEGAVRLVE